MKTKRLVECTAVSQTLGVSKVLIAEDQEIQPKPPVAVMTPWVHLWYCILWGSRKPGLPVPFVKIVPKIISSMRGHLAPPFSGRGSAQILLGELTAYSISPESLTDGQREGWPLPKNPALTLGVSCLGLRPLGALLLTPQFIFHNSNSGHVQP